MRVGGFCAARHMVCAPTKRPVLLQTPKTNAPFEWRDWARGTSSCSVWLYSAGAACGVLCPGVSGSGTKREGSRRWLLLLLLLLLRSGAMGLAKDQAVNGVRPGHSRSGQRAWADGAGRCRACAAAFVRGGGVKFKWLHGCCVPGCCVTSMMLTSLGEHRIAKPPSPIFFSLFCLALSYTHHTTPQ